VALKYECDSMDVDSGCLEQRAFFSLLPDEIHKRGTAKKRRRYICTAVGWQISLKDGQSMEEDACEVFEGCLRVLSRNIALGRPRHSMTENHLKFHW